MFAWKCHASAAHFTATKGPKVLTIEYWTKGFFHIGQRYLDVYGVNVVVKGKMSGLLGWRLFCDSKVQVSTAANESTI